MKQGLHHLCLLLGSNIQPERNLPQAIELLDESLTILTTSSVWESAAVGSDGPNVLNVAAMALTNLDPMELKEQVLHPIEAQLGRVRTPDKNSPRTIDIDLIIYDHQQMDENLWRYAHRAVPVGEILPDFSSETGEKLETVARRLRQETKIWTRPDISVF
jgi:2-amino-4-hydroxy-6-hydroxymethyldihydropteridine diphosphokinase